MQTLLERVARLERGYSELKGSGVPAAGGERRGSVAPDSIPAFTPPAQSGPLVEHRLDSLSRGLDDLRGLIDQLTAQSALAPAAPAASAADIASDVAGLKQEMVSLGETMRQITGKAYADAPVFSADLAHMKAEMLKLSVAMREMSQEMPKVKTLVEAAPAMAEDSRQIAKMKTEIAQLRAAVNAGPPLSAAAGPSSAAPAPADLSGLREEIAREFADVRAELDDLAAITADLGENPGARAREIASDVAGLKGEMASLGEAMREITNKAYAEAPNFSADLAHMKAEMLKLSVSMREMSQELPKTQAAAAKAPPPAEAAARETMQLARIKADIAQLRAAMEHRPVLAAAPAAGASPEISTLRGEIAGVHDSLSRGLAELRAGFEELVSATETGEGAAGHAREIAAEVASLKRDVGELGEAVRRIGAKAGADAPDLSADVERMKAEMLALGATLRDLSRDAPRLRAAGATASAGEIAQLATMKADIARLRAAHDDLAARVDSIDRTPDETGDIAADVDGLKREMAGLGEAMRQMTGKAYSEAPTFSADLAHMKAEMLKLGIALRDLTQEMPRVQAIASAVPDPAQLARIKADIASLRATVEHRPVRLAASAESGGNPDVSALRVEIAEVHESLSRDLAGLRAAFDEFSAPAEGGENPAARAIEVAADVAGLKHELHGLGEAMREITGKAYADAPAFSADLAHMKAEMLKLSVAIRDMTVELPKVQAATAALPDTRQIARINADIAHLRARVETLASREPVAIAEAPASPSGEVDDLRGSVQALIMLVAQSLNRTGEAA